MAAFLAPFVRFGAVSEQATANFGASAFAQAVPSGFTAGWLTSAGTSALASQAAVEVWVGNPPSVIVSEVALELFGAFTTARPPFSPTSSWRCGPLPLRRRRDDLALAATESATSRTSPYRRRPADPDARRDRAARRRVLLADAAADLRRSRRPSSRTSRISTSSTPLRRCTRPSGATRQVPGRVDFPALAGPGPRLERASPPDLRHHRRAASFRRRCPVRAVGQPVVGVRAHLRRPGRRRLVLSRPGRQQLPEPARLLPDAGRRA